MMRGASIAGAVPGLLLLLLCAVAFSSVGLSLWPPVPSPARTYYVATDGDDSHDGLAPARVSASRGPFRSLERASHAVKPGDTVEIRGGIYQAYSTWATNGTAAKPITITNHRDETVVIDGRKHTIPAGEYEVLLQIRGDWYVAKNLEVRYSGGTGVGVHGAHCTVDNIAAHHNWGSGIYITGWHGLIANCRAYANSLNNENFRPHDGGWGFGISACRYPQYTTIRGCSAWDNWGEGISTFESHHITIEDCVSYNNQQNYYISDTKYCLFQRNISYCTPGNVIQGYVTQNGILIGDEKRNPASSDNTYINNLVMGGERNLAAGGPQLVNCLVAHNTFVNASPTAGTESACVLFYEGTATNARFLNNIILQEDRVAIALLGASGLMFGYNNWSKRPVHHCRGVGDVIGDPRLLKSGPTGPGSLRPEWFRISVTSPARDRAIFLEDVNSDMAKSPRGKSPDMGAFEAPTHMPITTREPGPAFAASPAASRVRSVS